MNAILLHGRPDKEQWEDPTFPSTSNYYWLPWAQKQFALNGIPTETPEVPNAWIPDYAVWQKTFEQFAVNSDTILVGHSCGAGFIVRWLCEHKDVVVDKVVLVAPWVDASGDPGNKDSEDFFNFTYDKNLAARSKRGIVIINSTDDMETIQRSVKTIMESIDGVKITSLENRGHFFDESAREFPELLEEAVL